MTDIKYNIEIKEHSLDIDVKQTKENIVKEFIEKYKNEPKQQSEEWLAKRAKTVGGSELDTLINNKPEFVARKIGLRGNFSGMATIWGQVMEQVARRYFEMLYKCDIYEASSLPSAQVFGKSYSPDGIGVAMIDNLYKIILFEIKCVFSRVLKKGVIYKPYIPQIMSGMCDIPIIEQGMYGEFVFKICSLNVLTTNPFMSKSEAKTTLGIDGLGFNESFHMTSGNYFDYKPVAVGCMIFNADITTINDVTPVINNTICKFDGKSVIDIGSYSDENIVYNLFGIIKHYELDTQIFLNMDVNDPNEFYKKLSEWSIEVSANNKSKKLRKLFILPFKLMDTNIVHVKKQDNYTLQYKELIEDALGMVDKFMKISNFEERKAAWAVWKEEEKLKKSKRLVC